jgi:hypothetical protein
MARVMSQADVVDTAVTYFPSFLRSRKAATRLEKWADGKQYELATDGDGILQSDPTDVDFGQTFSPTGTEAVDAEYDNLRSLAPSAFAGLIVSSVAQTAYIEGIRRPGTEGNLPIWTTFRRNHWLSKQGPIHRTAIGQAVAYGIVTPEKDPLGGGMMAKMMARSPKDLAAFYATDDDEWPTFGVEAYPLVEKPDSRAFPIQTGWTVQIWDVGVVHRLSCKGNGETAEQWTYIDHATHNMPVVPIARCVNKIDLQGRATGELESVLPLLRRIDQDVFDRLITQRFGAWQVRYIAGMAKPSTDSEQRAQKIKLRQEDLLVSTSENTKFGVLPGGQLDPVLKATDADIRMLSAISQIPSYHLMGLADNLAAEAVSAASEGLRRKSFDFRTNAGDFHEQMARLVAMAEGDLELALAYDLTVRWRNTDIDGMSWAQAADALGKLAIQLKVPLEMLWEQIPGWTDDDVERAKAMVESGGLDQLLALMAAETAQAAAPPQQQQQGQTGGNGNQQQ